MWHCPSCGAPQAETARCWVCRRSSTTCSTCTHFRRALAGDLGFCGLDARRRPMTGDELRGCWEPKAEAAEVTVLSNVLDQAARVRRGRAAMPAYRPEEGAPIRGFVPVEAVDRAAGATPGRRIRPATRDEPAPVKVPPTDVPPPLAIDADPGWGERTSLFGDPEA